MKILWSKNMKKLMLKTASCVAVAAALSSSAFADTIAVGPKVSTQGIGAEARMPVMENGFVRIGANYFKFNNDHTIKNFGSELADEIGAPGEFNFDLDFKGKVTLMTVPVMFDYHPFDNSGFRISAGIAYNGNKVDIKGTIKNPAAINANTGQLTALNNINVDNRVGTVKGKVKIGSSVGGLLTLGYDSSFVSQNPLSFNFEAGIMYTGKPKLTVSTTGDVLSDEEARAYIQKKARKEFKSIDKYLQFYPVLSLGVKYTF